MLSLVTDSFYLISREVLQQIWYSKEQMSWILATTGHHMAFINEQELHVRYNSVTHPRLHSYFLDVYFFYFLVLYFHSTEYVVPPLFIVLWRYKKYILITVFKWSGQVQIVVLNNKSVKQLEVQIQYYENYAYEIVLQAFKFAKSAVIVVFNLSSFYRKIWNRIYFCIPYIVNIVMPLNNQIIQAS